MFSGKKKPKQPGSFRSRKQKSFRFTLKSDRRLPCSYIVEVFDLFSGNSKFPHCYSGDQSITVVFRALLVVTYTCYY